MRIVTYRASDGSARHGTVDGDTVLDAGTDLGAVISGDPGAPVGHIDDVALLAPVPRPGKVVCVGRNYAAHGPWIVTTEEIPDPQALGIRCLLNGEVRQDDTTANMLFSVAQVIAFTSEAITLDPGDVIFMGTPPGVGHGMDPPRYLAPGDVVRVEIERIGAIEHRIVAT